MLNNEKYTPIKDYNVARSGTFHIITDSWWIVDDFGTPVLSKKHNTPQCNENKAITTRLANGESIRRIPIVYVPINLSDYRE